MSSVKPTVPDAPPLAPESICSKPGLDDVAVQVPQTGVAVTLNVAGTSGAKPQFGWPELFGQTSAVDVPVAGNVNAAGAILMEHGLERLSASALLEAAEPPPEALTRLVTCAGAFEAIFTVTTIGG